MSEIFVVGYDGSTISKRALDFALARAAAQDASVVVAFVLEWSAFSFLTPTEIEERHVRRKEELARAHAALIEPLLASKSDSGVTMTAVVKYGHVADTLCRIATEENATQIYVGRNGSSATAQRVFGSVAGSLAQSSPVPCTIVP